MELLTVSIMNGSEEEVRKLYQKMTSELDYLHNETSGVRLDYRVNSSRSDITCTAVLPGFQLKTGGARVYERIGRAIADYVIKDQEMPILHKLITEEYDYSLQEDIQKIIHYCMELLHASLGENDSTVSRRKVKMSEEISTYLEQHTHINIDGFIRFRLQNYLDELRDVVEYAIDEYRMDKQYQEFISLLKYFVYIQDAKIPAAHLMHKGDNDFILLNEQFEPIETKQMEGVVVEMVDKEINYEDMIVSTLITVSPQKVYIHTRQPEIQVIKTIQQIFEDRASLCTYCGSCRPVLGEKEKQGHLYT